MKPIVEVDREHGIAYINLASGVSANTIAVSDGIILDISATGQVIGIELLNPDLEEIKRLEEIISQNHGRSSPL